MASPRREPETGVRVSCPTPRTDENYLTVDAAIAGALAAHYGED